MATYSLAVIGTGNMGSAIINGLLGKELFTPGSIIVRDKDTERMEMLVRDTGVNKAVSNEEAVRSAEITLLAVKPRDITPLLKEIRNAVIKDSLIISIAAGITTAAIESELGKIPVIRVMPNTPALIGEGVSCICKGRFTNDSHLKKAGGILAGVGHVEEVPEKLMDAVTGLSGSGPAYVYEFIDALALGGVKTGLTGQLARTLAVRTVFGAAKMLIETGEHPGVLRDMVTSPGGTTIAGLSALKEGGFNSAVIRAVEMAAKRSEELGK